MTQENEQQPGNEETQPAEEQQPVDQGDGGGNDQPPADTDPTAE